MKQTCLLSLLALGLASTGCKKEAATTARAVPVFAVQAVVAEAKVQPVNETLSLVGSVAANEMVEIKSETDGTLEEVLFTEGQRVKKGELIIEIQDNDPNLLNNLKAQREAIESRRDFAQGRVESLIAQITQQELAKAQAIDGAEQRVAGAKIAAERSWLS